MNARSDKEKLMDFQCTLRQHGRLEHWTAQIRLISCNESQQELEIKGRGSSFHLFVGFGMFGNYLCIPSQDIGCAIAQPEDSFLERRVSQQTSEHRRHNNHNDRA